MADLIAHHPLEGLQASPDLGLGAGPMFVRFNLRAGEAVLPQVADALGFALPQTACRSASRGDRHALWLGPDEWLLLCAPDDALGDALAATLAGVPASLVEVSGRQTALIVSGPRTLDLISAGCPLDLGLSAFPIGMCTRTLFGKAEIVLWRTGETQFHIEVWRSFAGYVWGLLEAGGAS
jgi:sarcosine oxidase subunit gamma